MKRILLGALGALLVVFIAVPAGAAHMTRSSGLSLDSGQFPYGVASFDVRPTAVNIWTQTAATRITFDVATDAGFTNIVRSGHIPVSPTRAGPPSRASPA